MITLPDCLPSLEKDLLEEIGKHAKLKRFDAQDYIVKQRQIVRFLPIVITGNVKVFSHEETMQFLLYYISSGETCIFSYAHIFNEEPAAFSAVAKEDSHLLLLPITKVKEWYAKYPRFNEMILKGYQKHYNNLLETTKQVICYNLEERLLNYLSKRTKVEKTNILHTSHQEIADDLGTSREVITRLMKKLDANGKATQVGRKIKIL